jgi:uncharacterized protein YfaS (alpha-2-macroglobulin family)
MLNLLGAMAAMMSWTPSGGQDDGVLQPINMVVEPIGDGIRVRVVGASGTDYEAVYSLEVTSDVAGGGNRSSHRGSANLRPGDAVTLSSVTLGEVTPGNWRAHLIVEPRGGKAYEQTRTSL